jgi:flagellar biosynthesis/type III secretory pathway protein FliH
MSSSRILEPPRLPDLSRETAQSRTAAFVATPRLEVVQSSHAPSLSADEAYAKGLADGEVRGRAEAERRLAPMLESLTAVGRSMLVARREVLTQAEHDLIVVATALARAVLLAEIRMPSDLVLRQAQRCIESAAADQGVLRLHVSPADLELARTHVPVLETQLGAASLVLVEDAHIPPGGVVLETRDRCYEGRPERLLDSAFARIAAAEAGLDAALPRDTDAPAPSALGPRESAADESAPGESTPPAAGEPA